LNISLSDLNKDTNFWNHDLMYRKYFPKVLREREFDVMERQQKRQATRTAFRPVPTQFNHCINARPNIQISVNHMRRVFKMHSKLVA